MNRHVATGFAVPLVCLIAFSLVGCISTYFVPIEPGAPFQLTSDEALLMIQVDTDLPIERLDLSGLSIRDPIEVGRYFWVAKVRPGRQTWRTVKIAGNTQHAGIYRVRRSKYPRASELDFNVEPGVINYAGELIIRNAGAAGFQTWISVRVRNHAAMALRNLEQKYPDLLDRYSIRMAGTSGDAFIDFYVAERARIAKEEATPRSDEHRE